MKNSFNSFKDIQADKWVVNVRGSYNLKTILFLNKNLGEKLNSHMLNSKKGWMYDTQMLLPEINSEYVLFWIEDHINMEKVETYRDILKEIKEYSVDHLIYSWWHETTKNTYQAVDQLKGKNLKIYDMNLESVNIINKDIGKFFYIVTMQSITNVNFFKKIINTNILLKRWPKNTPFDFEKNSKDISILPFRTSIPRMELFANIDDDHDNPGYSLISRGLYKEVDLNDSLREVQIKLFNKRPLYLKNITKNKLYIMLSHAKNIVKRIKYTLW